MPIKKDIELSKKLDSIIQKYNNSICYLKKIDTSNSKKYTYIDKNNYVAVKSNLV